MMSLTEDIRDYTLNLGYAACGFTTADPFGQFAECLAERGGEYGTLDYLGDFSEPRKVLSTARSIMVAVRDYSQLAFPEELSQRIGRLFLSRCYMAPPASVDGQRLALLRRFLQDRGITAAEHVNRRSGVPDRQAAARAGVGRFGCNNFICMNDGVSFVHLTVLVLDAELEPDEPTLALHCPEGCRLCMDACPTGALIEPCRLDPRRCIAYNTFVRRGEENGIDAVIPSEIRVSMGGWVYGCDVCQTVCPRNLPRLRSALPPDAYLQRKAAEFDLRRLLQLDDAFYGSFVQPLMHQHTAQRAVFRRNAAIAMGNSGDRSFVPALRESLRDDQSAIVRRHAAWALGRLGGGEAVDGLRQQLSVEGDTGVRQEINEALSAVSA